MIFNKENRIIYSSTGDRQIVLSDVILDKIRRKGYLYFSENETEAVGKWMDNNGGTIVVASGYDKYGKRKLSNLLSVLSICWLGGIFITGLLSYIYVKRIFGPLDALNTNIQKVTEGNLKQRVAVGPANDELTTMAKNFNKMLDQLEQSFAVQKNFLQHASHELRTPLSSLLLETEAALNKESHKKNTMKRCVICMMTRSFL